MNNIVYEYTVYGDGQYNYYLPLYNLFNLIDKIIACGERTKCINFDPFFISLKTGYIEFDEYMCYIECSNNEDASTNNFFIARCESEKETMSEARMHYALCRNSEEFHNAPKGLFQSIYGRGACGCRGGPLSGSISGKSISYSSGESSCEAESSSAPISE